MADHQTFTQPAQFSMNPVMMFNCPPANNLRVMGLNGPLVTISLDDGSLTYGPDYMPDEAARTFWETIGRLAPVSVPPHTGSNLKGAPDSGPYQTVPATP